MAHVMLWTLSLAGFFCKAKAAGTQASRCLSSDGIFRGSGSGLLQAWTA